MKHQALTESSGYPQQPRKIKMMRFLNQAKIRTFKAKYTVGSNTYHI